MSDTTTKTPFAVIEAAGKQYRVAEGDMITLDHGIDGDAGKAITFDQVLLVHDGKATKVGTPTVTGAKVTGELVASGKGKKTLVQRFRSKSRHHRRYGHRQPESQIKITKIA